MEKTIASIVTPLAEGGIGVIQVTGPSALKIVNNIFKSKKIENLELSQSNRLYYGYIYDENNNQIDEVIVNIYRKSNCFVTDDLAEINCHGGIYIVKRILDLLVSYGAQRVDWREVAPKLVGLEINQATSLDLIQNEALSELVQAKTRLGAKVLLDQYMGALTQSLSTIVKQIEDVEHFICKQGINTNLTKIESCISLVLTSIEILLNTFEFGKAITIPGNIVLIGRPNVGKSTLINKLLGEDRALVHDKPGTTRDPVSELISIKGIPFNLIDTAGIRQSNNAIEKKGIELTNTLIFNADIVVLMIDSSVPLESADFDILNFISTNLNIKNHEPSYSTNREDNDFVKRKETELILVMNKTDLPFLIKNDCSEDLFLPIRKYLNENDIVNISAINGTGVPELKEKLVFKFINYTNYNPGTPVIFKGRQFKFLFEAYKMLKETGCLINDRKKTNLCQKMIGEVKLSLLNCLRKKCDD